MEILLKRKWPRNKYIIGQLFINGEKFCDTLEPPYNREHPCIPAGTYEFKLQYSPKFKGTRPRLQNVPGREAILIHEGNYPQDTLGCILVGRNTQVGAVLNSRATFKELMAELMLAQPQKFSITIKECY